MLDNRSLTRRTTALVTAGAAALVLAACGADQGSAGHDGHSPASAPAPSPTSAPASPGAPNAADRAFTTGMIPHHRQAVEMADLAPGRAGSAEVKDLAAQIQKAQGPEITTLTGWLEAWGEEVPGEDATHHSAHGSGGMMSAEDMEELRAASGAAFDEAFLRMMIEHHEGAVAMAEEELADGSHGPARRMAEDIVASQSAEIDRMRELLGRD
ncbi:DUF305 domain-containing protein [Streptomyces sp. NPDC047130]|uniref:DUF305 domain-containing protein n=1 Tax=Streptomyces sp. NPDC047130 TaxID=3155261 RepID=UPI0033F8ACF8